MTNTRTAIWCTPHAYRSVARLGVHHLTARLAARGWNVLFLSNPISPLHSLKWRNMDTHLRLSAAMGGVICERGDLRSVLPITMLPLAGCVGARSRWVLDHWPAFTVPGIAGVVQRAGFDRPDLMVLDGPIAAPLMEIVKPRRSALRILDRLRKFSSTTPAMLGALGDIARRVDVVTYSAEELSADVDLLAPRQKLHLANGADIRHFAAPSPMPAAYRAIPEPRAVYVGTMAEWFDYQLVETAARQRPGVSFVLIGPQELARRRLPELPNLHILGPRPWQDLPAYLQHAAVGLIPFDIRNHRELVEGINPLKLYEYMASGLPVVSVAWEELRKLDAPIALADSAPDFVRAIDRMLQAPPPSEALKAFAARYDWNVMLDQFLATLGISDDQKPCAAEPAGLAGVTGPGAMP